MNSFNRLHQSLTQNPIEVLVAKTVQRLRNKTLFLKDRFFDTRTSKAIPIIETSFVSANSLDVSQIDEKVMQFLIDQYLVHKHDLLGSGWIKNDYFSSSPGFENTHYPVRFNFTIDTQGEWLKNILRKNDLKKSRTILALVRGEYEPIDWQKDQKSGWRWDQKIHFTKQPIGHVPGVDVKLPWELSRMQHLVQLAIFAVACEQHRERILNEYRNQILDFIATNPPRQGINWVCSMDVGIRAANMLVSYDILKQLDDYDIFDIAFCQTFSNSIYQHGQHIINNLEYSRILTTNHYLANCAGLLFVAAYLKPSLETDFWLIFSMQEIINEVSKQFYPDGGNFESSTSYHCLSTEFITYGTALAMGIDQKRKAEAVKRTYTRFSLVFPFLKKIKDQEFNLEKSDLFPHWYIERLYRSGKLICDITKPNGNIAQIGDNDSGKFFRFLPYGRLITEKEAFNTYLNLQNNFPRGAGLDLYWDENSLSHKDLTDSLFSLFNAPDYQLPTNNFERSLIHSLAGGNTFLSPTLSRMDYQFKFETIPEGLFLKRIKIPFKVSREDLKDVLKNALYPNAGYCIYQAPDLHLVIFFGSVGQNGLGGHSHNDKLSFELFLDDENVAVDPGTYVYTASSAQRNLFRSTAVHNSISTGFEQNDFDASDLFRMHDQSKCEILNKTWNKISFSLRYKQVVHFRIFTILPDGIEIEDHSNVDFRSSVNNFESYSSGYGKVMAKKSVR